MSEATRKSLYETILKSASDMGAVKDQALRIVLTASMRVAIDTNILLRELKGSEPDEDGRLTHDEAKSLRKELTTLLK